MIRPYKYRVIDHSLLTPYMRQYLAGPLARLLPRWLPANMVTLCSNLFVYYALYLQLTPGQAANAWIIPLCLFLYALGDHMDGMQAKKTGTGSPLGEYLDHYLDVFNSGIVVFLMASAYPLTQSWLPIVLAACTYLAHAMTMYEQYKTGWLVFEKLGSLEAVLLCVLFLGGSGLAPVREVLTRPVLLDFSLFAMVLVLAGIGALTTTVRIIWRSGRPGWKFYTYIAVQVLLVGLYFQEVFSGLQTFALLGLAAGSYIGSVMYGHLINGREYMADPFLLSLLAGLCFFPAASNWAIWYLAISVICLFGLTFFRLRSFWVWYNKTTNS